MCLFFLGAQAQAVYKATFTGEVEEMDLDVSGTKYVATDAYLNQVNIYNHDDFKKMTTISLNIPTGFTLNDVTGVSEKVFDSDSDIEVMYLVFNGTDEYRSLVCDEQGNIVKAFNDVNGGWTIYDGTAHKAIIPEFYQDGLFDFYIYDIANNYNLETAYRAKTLYNNIPEGSTDFMYYYIDDVNGRFYAYDKDHKEQVNIPTPRPTGYVVFPNVIAFSQGVFDFDNTLDFAYVIANPNSNPVTYVTRIVNTKGTILETFANTAGLQPTLGDGNQHNYSVNSIVSNNAISSYELYDYTSTGVSLSKKVADPTRMRADGSYLTGDLGNEEIYWFDNKHDQTAKLSLPLKSGEAAAGFYVVESDLVDGDGTDEEVAIWAQNATATEFTFYIFDENGNTLYSNVDVDGFSYREVDDQMRLRIIKASGNQRKEDLYIFEPSIGAFELTSPANAAIDVPVDDATFTWEEATNALGYEIFIDTDQSFSSPITQTSTTNTIDVSGLNGLTKYYWKVRAYNDNYEGWSTSTFTFTTENGLNLDAPTLIAPANQAKDQETDDLELSWQSVTDALTYEYEYSEDNTFASSFLAEVSTTSVKLNTLDNDQIYFWRVRARNGVIASAWSDVWFFTTKEPTPIAIPEQVSPKNGAKNQSAAGLALGWKPVADAISYTVEYDTELNMNTAIDATETGTSHSIATLENSTVYYWRVKVETKDGVSDWSPIWSFTTIDEAGLAIPNLLSPANESADVPVEGTRLEWSGVGGADRYEYQISTKSDFSTYTAGNTTVTHDDLSKLDEDTKYYWRVRAKKGGNNSNWSATWFFTTEIVKSVIDPELGKLELYPNPASEFVTLEVSNGPALVDQIAVYSLDGKQWQVDMNVSSEKLTMNVANLPAGNYLVKVGESSLRFIKE